VTETVGTKVLVLMGGRSAEREISLVTGHEVAEALLSRGFDTITVDSGEPDFIDRIRSSEADVVFICLHGCYGEDGTVQGLLELLDMPYVGSGVLASALAMDKAMTKAVFEARGIPTPRHVLVRRGETVDVDAVVADIGAKSVVKPVREGSALGVTIVHEPSELLAAIQEAFRYDAEVLIEEFVEGVEVTVGILGIETLDALPTIEIVPEHEFYDFESKYAVGMSRHIIPARVSEAADSECIRISVEAHKALGCRGVSRVDLIVDDQDVPWVLEVNTIPGMTPTSLLPDAARAAGIDFAELCERLVLDAF